MLNDYRDRQILAYNIFKNELNNNMLSHAYLIDANHYDKSFDFVLSFVKSITGVSKFFIPFIFLFKILIGNTPFNILNIITQIPINVYMF
mgnify:CR=1 FL=1